MGRGSPPRPVRPCAACGAEAPPPFRAPAAESAPDLDLRPSEPARSTQRRWIACCQSCGACGPDLSALPDGAAVVAGTDAYRTMAGLAGILPFLRWAMICEAAGQRSRAAKAVLQAAWVLDDAGQDAAALRRRAVALWYGDTTPNAQLQRVDALRRAGCFAEAEQAIAQADMPDETSRLILRFQRDRIAERDTRRHLISSALRPPARTPHAQHGRSRTDRPRGLWARLLGR